LRVEVVQASGDDAFLVVGGDDDRDDGLGWHARSITARL
jgi:hypothetical protein